MVWSGLKVGSVIAGRGARACDMCGKERARWYCSSDEAYLCEKCDRSVHSANSVARRHERMKLGPNGELSKIKETFDLPKTIKLSSLQDGHSLKVQEEDAEFFHKSWCGMKKRCRSARKCSRPLVHSMQEPFLSHVPTAKAKAEDDSILLFNLVPGHDRFGDIAMPLAISIKLEPPSPSILRDFTVPSEEGDDAHHEVPIYNPLLQELVTDSHGNFMEDLVPSFTSLYNDGSSCKIEEQCSSRSCAATTLACVHDDTSQQSVGAPSLQSHELDMGAVLEIGTNLANGGSDIDTFDLMELCSNTDLHESTFQIETQEVLPDMAVWKAAYESDQRGTCRSIFKGNPFKGRGVREFGMNGVDNEGQAEHEWKAQPISSKPLSLRLDYEEVLHAWSDRGSLWMDGQRPQVVPDIFSLDLGGKAEGQEVPVIGGSTGGREARVVRYRQKRHTRLFRKTIRYEVRKVNAERRPRLKGRFVKRSSLEGV